MGFNDERKRMNEGELYRSNDAEILKEQLQLSLIHILLVYLLGLGMCIVLVKDFFSKK